MTPYRTIPVIPGNDERRFRFAESVQTHSDLLGLVIRFKESLAEHLGSVQVELLKGVATRMKMHNHPDYALPYYLGQNMAGLISTLTMMACEETVGKNGSYQS